MTPDTWVRKAKADALQELLDKAESLKLPDVTGHPYDQIVMRDSFGYANDCGESWKRGLSAVLRLIQDELQELSK